MYKISAHMPAVSLKEGSLSAPPLTQKVSRTANQPITQQAVYVPSAKRQSNSVLFFIDISLLHVRYFVHLFYFKFGIA